jgi:flagellar motor switch protein FliM
MEKLTVREIDILASLLRRAIANLQFEIHKEWKATADMEEVKEGDWKEGEETFSGDGTATQEFECVRMVSTDEETGKKKGMLMFAIPQSVVNDMYNEKEITISAI